VAYIGAWGVSCSKKVDNGLKLLFRVGSECSGIVVIIQIIN
jgi:hypothetical protein